MRRHHTGSGRRSVIGKDWAAHHRPVVAGTLTATCEIRHPGGIQGDFDEATGKRTLTPNAPHYTGGCRIQISPQLGGDRETGAEQVVVSGYLVVIDLDTSGGTAIGDQLQVTAVTLNGDLALIGRTLTVAAISSGSLAWERDLTCTDPLG